MFSSECKIQLFYTTFGSRDEQLITNKIVIHRKLDRVGIK